MLAMNAYNIIREIKDIIYLDWSAVRRPLN